MASVAAVAAAADHMAGPGSTRTAGAREYGRGRVTVTGRSTLQSGLRVEKFVAHWLVRILPAAIAPP